MIKINDKVKIKELSRNEYNIYYPNAIRSYEEYINWHTKHENEILTIKEIDKNFVFIREGEGYLHIKHLRKINGIANKIKTLKEILH
jgi:hypothetical protein